jgi:D-alanyl-D-alanine carboxypeptidase (penicillin-binding protein 5/6)
MAQHAHAKTVLRLSAALAALVFLLGAAANLAAADTPGNGSASISTAPSVSARSAVIIDATTGALLYAKNPDLVLPPASLTKIITLHIVYEEIAAGRMSPDELVEIDKNDCSPVIPYGSSLMYLHPKMKVSVRDLMLGAAVVSGNDAAYSLARRISGSNEAFAERMNKEVQALGFDKMTFVEPSGLSEFNLVTARQYALFCRKYLELHPQALGELHSVKSIEFPRAEHAAPGFVPNGTIKQYNRNPLIFSYDGADGLKTGYIIEVGFNMAATAKRGDTRFIVVTLGGTGGGSQRTKDTTRLLDWGFKNFQTASIDPGALPAPRAWFGAQRTVSLVPATPNAVTLPQGKVSGLSQRVVAPAYVDAPVKKGQKLGQIIYSVGGADLRSIDLVASADVPRGGFFRRVWDGIVKFFTVGFKKK